jgi:uncharacterized membrane protein
MASAQSIRESQRAARAVWGEGGGGPITNVGSQERLVSQVGGGVLVAVGLLRGGVKGLALAGLGGALLYRGSTGHCHLYEALGASTADDGRGAMGSVPARAGVRVEEAITIDRPADELYRYWRDYANMPRFMDHVESVTPVAGSDGKRSHWVLKGPLGVRVEYDAEIHNETPGELIAWRSLDGGDLDTAGSIRFTAAPGGRGTEVRVNQKFHPPGGKLGVAAASLLGRGPETLTRESLRRLKQLMEAGEVPTVAGQPSGPA